MKGVTGEKQVIDAKHKKGFLNHWRAIEWLTKHEYYVYSIAMDMDGNIIKIDVKSESTRKTGRFAGYKIKRILSDTQKSMGVKLLMVTEDGKCYFYKND
jgi:hypothetical protein